jgi:dTDP-4-dehydrorhamnose reductase
VRIVVTGAGGGLARAFLGTLPSHHDVHAFDRAALDVGDHDAVRQIVEPLRPDAVVNLAAFTKVDANETDPARAFRDNGLGPQHLALAARSCGAVLLHVSTDFVFDGRKGAPFDETDRPSPLSVYGRAKLEGERFVRSIQPASFVVRVGYVYGGGKDYLSGAARRLADGQSAGGLDDRVGSPTFVGHLAERLLPLLLTGRFGTYHLGGPQPASWFDVLTMAREIGGLDGIVERQRSEELGLVAPRPPYSALSSVYLDHLGIPAMPSMQEGVEAFLETLGRPAVTEVPG